MYADEMQDNDAERTRLHDHAHKIRGRRPTRSARAPLPSWARLHVSGYTALMMPISSTASPCAANSSGSTPHDTPSLRLLTSEMKFLRGDQRDDRALESNHAANAGVDEN